MYGRVCTHEVGGGAVMCGRVTQGWGWGCDVWQGLHTRGGGGAVMCGRVCTHGVGCGVCDTVHVGCITPDGLHQHHGNQASQA